eukprot:721183-Pelagomonas_calceolata.AAC.1
MAGGGVYMHMKRSHATCAWVWAAGVVKAKVQPINLDFQASDNGRHSTAQCSQGGSLWTC